MRELRTTEFRMKNLCKHFAVLVSVVLALALAVPVGSAYALQGDAFVGQSDVFADQVIGTLAEQEGGVGNDPTPTLQALKTKAPKKVKGVKAVSAGHTSVTVTWKKVSGATGYEVFRASGKSGTYAKVGVVRGGAKKSFTNKKLKTGTPYFYKVRAVSGGSKGAFSKVVAGKPVPKAPQIKTVVASHDAIKVSWNRVSGATGYEVYRATSKTGKYTKVGAIQGGTKKSFTNKKLKANKTYYFKVRAVCKGGKGALSASKNAKIYANRTQRPSAPSNPAYTYVWVNTSHYERVVVTPAWDEAVYEIHGFCDVCSFHSAVAQELYDHIDVVHGGLAGYSTGSFTIIIHHPAVYEEVWVVSGYWKLIKRK
jgi:hypothetical protein